MASRHSACKRGARMRISLVNHAGTAACVRGCRACPAVSRSSACQHEWHAQTLLFLCVVLRDSRAPRAVCARSQCASLPPSRLSRRMAWTECVRRAAGRWAAPRTRRSEAATGGAPKTCGARAELKPHPRRPPLRRPPAAAKRKRRPAPQSRQRQGPPSRSCSAAKAGIQNESPRYHCATVLLTLFRESLLLGMVKGPKPTFPRPSTLSAQFPRDAAGGAARGCSHGGVIAHGGHNGAGRRPVARDLLRDLRGCGGWSRTRLG